MYTIGQLVKEFQLSRSTLLYYDRIGLLRPSARSDANYRLYTAADLARMQQIILYKDAGLSLEAIPGTAGRTGQCPDPNPRAAPGAAQRGAERITPPATAHRQIAGPGFAVAASQGNGQGSMGGNIAGFRYG